MSSWPPFLFVPIPHFFFEAGIFDDPCFFQFLCYAMESTYRQEHPQSFCFNGQTIILERGEFIFGRSHWSKKLQMTEAKVRRCLDQLTNQQIAGRVSSKTTSKMTVYKWLWASFPDSSRRQNHQKITGKTPANPPQTKKQTLEEETTTAPVAVFSDIDASTQSLIAALPTEEQTAILNHLNNYKATNPIKNIGGWLRRCIEHGWHKQSQLPQPNATFEANKALARSICQQLTHDPEIQCHMYQDLFEIKLKNGTTYQLLYCDDSFSNQLLKKIKNSEELLKFHSNN